MRAVGADELSAVLEPLRRGRCVLCLGGELAADGSLRRLIGKLLQQLPDADGARALVENKPLMAADYVRRRLGAQFPEALKQVTQSATAAVPETLALLGTLPFSAVLTTSYDSAVERAFARGDALPAVYTPREGAALRAHGRSRFVYKLLGDPARPDTVVWGAADLQAALAGGGYQPIADELFANRSFLLLGFDWIDAELSVLLERILSGAPRGRVEHFAVLPRMSPLEREELHAIYGIRVLEEEDAGALVRALQAAMSDLHRALPDEQDIDGWLGLLANDPGRTEVLDRLEALELQLRSRGDAERLVELQVGRTAVEPSAERRAALLAEAARLLDEDLHDPARALTALLAGYEEAPSRKLWDDLDRLAAATRRWRELDLLLAKSIPSLKAEERADAWTHIAALRDEELDDVPGALAATEAALSLKADHREALEIRLRVLRRSGRWKELSEALGRALLAEESLARQAELYFTLGDVYEIHLADPGQAAALYRLAIDADPFAGEARAALEQLLLRRGEFGELLQLLEERFERAAPAEQPAIRRRMAELCEGSLGDRALAIQNWEKLRAQAPNEQAALLALARLYGEEGRTRDLIAVLEDAAARTESERDRVELLRRLAAEQEKQPGGAARAAEHLENLLTIGPHDAEALAALERVYRADGRLHELVASIERHLPVAPADVRPRLELEQGAALESLGELSRAQDSYLRALELDPELGEAFDALLRLADTPGALERLVQLCEQRAARATGEQRVALYAKAGEIAGERLGDAAGAESLFARALEIDPRHVPALIGLGQLYRRQGELLKAARLFTEAADHTQNRLLRTRLLVEAGEIYERFDEPEPALGVYRRALEIDPEHVDAAARTSELLWRAGRHKELVPILEVLAYREAPRPIVIERLVRLGAAARAIGQRERAEKAFRRALELEPAHLDALRGLGTLLFNAGAFADAAPVLEELRRHHEPMLPAADQVELYHHLGVCDLQAGRQAEAREKFAVACAIDPTHRPSRLAQLEMGVKDPQQQIEAKKALLPTASKAEKVMLHLEIGDLYLDGLDDPVHATGSWMAGLQVQPDEVRLLHRLLNVYVQQKAWSQAMEVLSRLILGQPKPETRAKYEYTAGMICLEHLGRFADGAEHLWASVEGDPTYRRAAVALEEMLRNHKSWKELVRFFQVMLQKLEPFDTPEKRADQLRMWSELSELYSERLKDLESAIVAYQVVLKLDPSAKRRQHLALLYTSAGPSHVDHAIEQHHALLRDDKTRLTSYRALKELYEETDRAAQAAACAQALTCLYPEADANGTNGQNAVNGTSEPLPEVRRPLTSELWTRLRHPDEDPELSALFAAVAGAVAATQASRDRLPLDRRRLVAADDPRPFARAMHRAAGALGVPAPAAYAFPEQAEAVRLTCAVDGQTVVPVLSFGRPLLDEKRPARELSFEVARAVAQLRAEHFIRWLLPSSHELAHVIKAAVALAADAGGKKLADEELEKTTAGFKRSLTPAVLNQVVALGHRLRGRDAESEALRWMQASDLTCGRVGFVVVGDLDRCARVLKHDAVPGTMLAPPLRILDLIWSSVTEEVFAARHHLGLA
jgi:tetratricopeptide (TPR) repeat protein